MFRVLPRASFVPVTRAVESEGLRIDWDVMTPRRCSRDVLASAAVRREEGSAASGARAYRSVENVRAHRRPVDNFAGNRVESVANTVRSTEPSDRLCKPSGSYKVVDVHRAAPDYMVRALREFSAVATSALRSH